MYCLIVLPSFFSSIWRMQKVWEFIYYVETHTDDPQ
jgi:hypothetical protein